MQRRWPPRGRKRTCPQPRHVRVRAQVTQRSPILSPAARATRARCTGPPAMRVAYRREGQVTAGGTRPSQFMKTRLRLLPRRRVSCWVLGRLLLESAALARGLLARRRPSALSLAAWWRNLRRRDAAAERQRQRHGRNHHRVTEHDERPHAPLLSRTRQETGSGTADRSAMPRTHAKQTPAAAERERAPAGEHRGGQPHALGRYRLPRSFPSRPLRLRTRQPRRREAAQDPRARRAGWRLGWCRPDEQAPARHRPEHRGVPRAAVPRAARGRSVHPLAGARSSHRLGCA